MSISLIKPAMISIWYKPEPDAPNRGFCEWARFHFDLDNYFLSIESDCGNYSYGWFPTPRSESFLCLCARMNEDYLLRKISSESVVDSAETFRLMEELVSILSENYDIGMDYLKYEMQAIHRICYSYNDPESVYQAIINDALEYSDLDDLYEPEDIRERICCTYPANAKKIAEIFCNEVQPWIKENLEKLEKEY